MRLPDFEPMLATKWPAPFEDEDWWFDVLFRGEDLTSKPYEERRAALENLGLSLPIRKQPRGLKKGLTERPRQRHWTER